MMKRKKAITQQHKTLNDYKIEKAIDTLILEIAYIRYVKDWAANSCVSYEWLKKWSIKAYNKSPKIIMREVRYEKIIFLIMKYGLESSSVYIAFESGVGKSSDALYKFLKVHYNTTFTRLKKEILTKEDEVKFIWLQLEENVDK